MQLSMSSPRPLAAPSRRALSPRYLAALSRRAIFDFLKMLCLVSLILLALGLLVPPPAHAQWVVQDASGNPIPQNADGSYGLHGTETNTLLNPNGLGGNYPDLILYANSNPNLAYVLSNYPALNQTVPASAISTTNSAFNAVTYSGNPAIGNFGPNNETITGTMSGSVTGQVLAYWKWVGPPALMPPYVDLLLRTSVRASASVGYGRTGVIPGLSASATATDEVNGQGFNETATAMAGDGASGLPTQTVGGYHLVRAVVDANTKMAEVYLNGQATYALSDNLSYGAWFGWYGYYATNGYTSASSNAGVSAAAKQDTRAASMVGGRATTKKVLIGGVDFNGDGLCQQVNNDFDANGTLTDDIAIPFGEKYLDASSGALQTIDTSQKITVTYSPALIGNWATEEAQYLENSSLKNYSLQGALGSILDNSPPTAADIPKITNVFQGPTVDNTNNGAIIWNDAGKTDHVFFKFTNGDNRYLHFPTGNDGDGAVASANYYLNIHHPLESFPSNRPSDTVCRIATAYPAAEIDPLTGEMDIPMTIDSPGYATYGTDGTNGLPINVHLNNPSVLWMLGTNATSFLSSVSFPTKLSILSAVFGLANLATSYYTPVAETHSIGFSDGAWNDTWSWGQGTGLKSYYHMFPRIRVRYTRTYTLVDSYDMSGFRAETMNSSDKFLDNSSSFGYFQYVGPP